MIYTTNITCTNANTAYPLASVRTPAGWVDIRAYKASGGANTGNVYISGGSTSANATATTGYPMKPGDEIHIHPLGGKSYIDLQQLWVDADNASDAIRIMYGVG